MDLGWLPWRRSEHRSADRSYTDVYLDRFVADAEGASELHATATACILKISDACAGAAQTSGRWQIAGDVRRAIVRELLSEGNAYRLITVLDGSPVLLPALCSDVRGGSDESTWRYSLTVAGPDWTSIETHGSDRVAHVRQNWLPVTPWRGRSPLATSPGLARLGYLVDRSLRHEHQTPVARLVDVLLPFKYAPDKKNDLSRSLPVVNLRGEGTVAAQIYDRGIEPHQKSGPHRLGPDPSQMTVSLRDQIRSDICAIYSTPPALLLPESSAAQSVRELRQTWLHGTVRPLMDLLTGELRRVLDDPDLAFVLPMADEQRADAEGRRLSRRAGAIAQLVGAGLKVADAERVADGRA